ncbi:arylsulfatase AtsA [Maricurvus nonylphenolicus]
MSGFQADNQQQVLGYQGTLIESLVTVPEHLRASGYRTYMAGKWHLGSEEQQLPHNRGFDKSFTLVEGGASHFADQEPVHDNHHVTYLENGEPTDLPEDFYSTNHYADKLVDYILEGDKETPFFAYLAFTAPHDPLQVPANWLSRYEGVYDEGPDVIRAQRLEKQKTLGLIEGGADLWQMPAMPEWLPLYKQPWQDRSVAERRKDTKPMEIYAAMIELVDQKIGTVLDALEESGKLENTYILFFSDNGASAATPLMYPNTARQWLLDKDNSLQNMGLAGSHVHLGSEWAVVSNTPWKLFKGTPGEGGIRSPMVMTGPRLPRSARIDSAAHVIDLAPTIYELAGVDWREDVSSEKQLRIQGSSLVPYLLNPSEKNIKPYVFELFGSQAIRMGNWKAHNIPAPLASGEWELFDLSRDPSELNNLAAEEPVVLRQLIDAYNTYAIENGVIPPEPPLKAEISDMYVGECDWLCGLKLDLVQLVTDIVH